MNVLEEGIKKGEYLIDERRNVREEGQMVRRKFCRKMDGIRG